MKQDMLKAIFRLLGWLTVSGLVFYAGYTFAYSQTGRSDFGLTHGLLFCSVVWGWTYLNQNINRPIFVFSAYLWLFILFIKLLVSGIIGFIVGPIRFVKLLMDLIDVVVARLVIAYKKPNPTSILSK